MHHTITFPLRYYTAQSKPCFAKPATALNSAKKTRFHALHALSGMSNKDSFIFPRPEALRISELRDIDHPNKIRLLCVVFHEA
jgi:hypothetical protein